MKTVWICGDSFATADPEYGAMWVDLLAEQLGSEWQIVNHSSVAASNLLISIQVTEALLNKPDYIIVLGTAVTRDHVSTQHSAGTLLERFNSKDLVAYSIFRPYRSALTVAEQQQVKEYHDRFFDLDLAIYRDQCIIANTLDRLVKSNIPFLFDQGGFEHPGYGGTQQYFEEYTEYRSAINLWDLGTTHEERPYYHITNPAAHLRIAQYYSNAITG
jgi:protein-tyrosine-phosphatase